MNGNLFRGKTVFEIKACVAIDNLVDDVGPAFEHLVDLLGGDPVFGEIPQRFAVPLPV